jgi:Flp pilus assembly protein TadG
MKLSGNPARSALRIERWVNGGRPLRPAGCVARVWTDSAATTSLEFALMALPFFGLVLGTFSIGVWYFYTASIDLAVYKTARQFMTGQIQSSGTPLTAASFTTALCSNMPSFVPCSASNPVISVNVVHDFNGLVTTTSQVNNNVKPPVSFTVTTLKSLPASACSPQQLDVVYIQALYTMPTLPVVYTVFGNTVISGTTVQVEEFPTTAAVSTNC